MSTELERVKKVLKARFKRCICKNRTFDARYYRELDPTEELPGITKSTLVNNEYLVFENSYLRILVKDAHKNYVVYDVKTDRYFPIDKELFKDNYEDYKEKNKKSRAKTS